jgi:hypothetical protein
MAIPGAQTVAKATGASGDDLAAMNRDTTQMATQMRTPGMRLTQMEFGKFLGANPSLNNSRANNQQAVAQINAARTGAAAKSAFYTKWLDARGSLDGADGAWLQFQSQHFSPDGQTYYHDPNDNPALKRAQGNAALKDKSAGSRATSDPLGIR